MLPIIREAIYESSMDGIERGVACYIDRDENFHVTGIFEGTQKFVDMDTSQFVEDIHAYEPIAQFHTHFETRHLSYRDVHVDVTYGYDYGIICNIGDIGRNRTILWIYEYKHFDDPEIDEFLSIYDNIEPYLDKDNISRNDRNYLRLNKDKLRFMIRDEDIFRDVYTMQISYI